MVESKVFGLSVTEEIEWGVCNASEGILLGPIDSGKFEGIPSGNLPHPEQTYVEIERLIRNRLEGLHQERPHIFADVTRIGVSTIGVVGRTNLSIDSLKRKNWKKSGASDGEIIDFKQLFLKPLRGGKSLFPLVKSAEQIVVQNDASARCKTEYIYNIGPQLKPLGLLYFAVGEGINGAFARGGDLLEMERHSEMGHIMPQLHPDDEDFDEAFSGCPSHVRCFEGVASNARIRRQWGAELSELPVDHPAWDVEAFYLAQLAMIGILTLNPNKILFGGAVFAGAKGLTLIDKVKAELIRQNGDYLPDYRSGQEERVADLISRAKFGNGVKILSALTMASTGQWTLEQAATVIHLHEAMRARRTRTKEGV
jgi:fructokinase